VNVRLISATNRNLEEMVKEGTFREDLFYRLNVIPIHVPPLRERPDDIVLLAEHFVGAHCTKMGRRPLDLSGDAEDALRAFRWPGNVRELENVLERTVALCMGERIEMSDLPNYVQNFVSEPKESVTQLPPGGLDLEGLIENIEVKLIKQALHNSRFSQKRAAELLGLTPRSLRYRLK
jgi:DNA-binding NtrC family response regulator